MEPADIEISDAERQWLTNAFLASVDSSVVTKMQLFQSTGDDRLVVVLGTAAELKVYPEADSVRAQKIFGSFSIDRRTLQAFVDQLASHNIRAK